MEVRDAGTVSGLAEKEAEEERGTRAKVIVAGNGEGRKRRAEERVARVRERSLVVLDEAADDPSLRFVLVAFLIFAIFVVVLLLSLVLG